MKLIIKNKDWEILKQLDAEVWKTLYKQITDAWIEIHHACNAWICGACMCEIEEGWEFIKKNMRTEPWFPLDESEVMTCIAWINPEDIEKKHNIILKTIY